MSKKSNVSTARSTFRRTYGTDTYQVVSMLSSGLSTRHVADEMDMDRTSIAGYASNLSRGIYDSFVRKCDFRRRWSDDAHLVVSMLRRGFDVDDIVDETDLPSNRVASFVANFNRGIYNSMA